MPRVSGPLLLSNLWNLRSILGSPLPWWRRWQEEDGDVVRIPLGVQDLVLLFHPEAVAHVLHTHRKHMSVPDLAMTPSYSRMLVDNSAKSSDPGFHGCGLLR
jgi:hypothetical protein